MKFENVAPKLGTWAHPLQPFIESEEMDKIFLFLKKRSDQGRVICPHHTDLFRAFVECPYETVRCVVIGQCPYPWVYSGTYAADGLAFSSRNTGKIEPSLEALYGAMETDLSGGFNLHLARTADLTYLAHQGVLLLNAALTVEKDDPGSHLPFVDSVAKTHVWVWGAFLRFLLEEVVNRLDPLPVVFVGSKAQRYSRLPVPFHHEVIEVEHPSYALRQERPWQHQHLFSRVNRFLREKRGTAYEIQWFQQHAVH